MIFILTSNSLECCTHFLRRPVLHSTVKNYIERQKTKRWLHFGALSGSRYGIIATILLCLVNRQTLQKETI